MTRERLGGLEQQVLLAMMRLGGDTYAVPIVLEIEQHGAHEISHASVYVALRRMEKRGLLTSCLRAPGPEERGRDRRFFQVRQEAIDLLQETKRTLSSLWDGVEALEESS